MTIIVNRFVSLYKKRYLRFYLGQSKFVEGYLIGQKGTNLIVLSYKGATIYCKSIPYGSVKCFSTLDHTAVKATL